MSTINVMVKHIFFDPELNLAYTLLISQESLEKIKSDQKYAAMMYRQAKRYHMIQQKLPEKTQVDVRGEASQKPELKGNDDQELDDERRDKSGLKHDDDQKENYEQQGIEGQKLDNEHENNEPENDDGVEVNDEQQDENDFQNDDEEESDGERRSRTPQRFIWTYNSICLLIASYENHAEELEHIKLKRHFWNNVTNDMVSHKYNVTRILCQIKWANLLKSYKEAKDNVKDKKTGRGSSKFLFFSKIDAVVGDKPSNSSAHVLGSMKKKGAENGKSKAFKKDKRNSRATDTAAIKIQLRREKLELEKRRISIEERKVDVIEKYLNLKMKEKP